VSKPQNGTFAKSGNSNGKINDIQAGAINGLLKAKKMTLEDATNKALNGTVKTSIEVLTQEEAKSIISFLNNLR
jgi:tRNA U34 5-carboxymethylaminomethyl modifying GTPase MnmE/TrmE